MAKQSGLGDNFYVDGYDLSGNVSALGQVGGGPATLDVTPIKRSANERIGGLRTADWQFTSFWESTTALVGPSFPTTGTVVNNTFAYDVLVTISGGSVTGVTVNGVSVGTGDGTYILPGFGTIAVAFTGSPTWTWTAIGREHTALSALPTTDRIGSYFRGSAVQSPAASIYGRQINYDPTRDNSGNLTLAVEIQSDGFSMEWGEQLTAGIRTDTAATTGSGISDAAATAFGCQMYVHLFDFVGTSVTIAVQHATTLGGTYSGLISTGALTALGAARVASSNATTVNQFLKVVTTGTFTYAAFAVNFVRNPIAGVVF
jgi:hypothetical protein